MTIQAWIYYIIASVSGIILFSTSGFFIYWQHSKTITIESPILRGLTFTAVFQFLFMTFIGLLLLEGHTFTKWQSSLLLSSAVTIVSSGAYWLLTLYLPFTHVLPDTNSIDRSTIGLKDILKKLSRIIGVRAVCLAGNDGFMVDSVVNSNEDAEIISALASGGFRISESMGNQLEMGGLNVSIIEYDNGPVILARVGTDTFLVIVAKKGANLGMIRMAILKQQIRLAISANV